jgi:hypothetical protein
VSVPTSAVLVLMMSVLVGVLVVWMVMGGRIVVVEPGTVLVLMNVFGIPVAVGMRVAYDGDWLTVARLFDVKPRLPYRAGVHRTRWVMLVYRLPRTPSTPRIALWRKLRRLGAVQVVDGVVALPLDSRNREQLEWLGDEVVEAGGEATVWVSETATAAQERALAMTMAAKIGREYDAIAEAALAMTDASDVDRRRTLARLRRELRRVGSRDYFPPPERDRARAAVEQLARSTVGVLR